MKKLLSSIQAHSADDDIEAGDGSYASSKASRSREAFYRKQMDGLINYLPSWLKKRYNEINPILSVKGGNYDNNICGKVRIKTWSVSL